jgi:hypothetical protein
MEGETRRVMPGGGVGTGQRETQREDLSQIKVAMNDTHESGRKSKRNESQ